MLHEILSKYQYLTNPVTLTVIGWLLLYLFFVFFVFFYRFFSLTAWISKENSSLNGMLMGGVLSTSSSLYSCKARDDKNSINACIEAAKQKAKKGLTFLAIVSSTAPFIGLFGTVVSILVAFGHMGNNTSLSLVAPAISEALIATAIGILVAIPAYSFHQILVAKFEDLISTLKMERDFFLND